MPESRKTGLFEKWWLLRHANPKLLNEQLRALNEHRAFEGIPEIAYIIPYLMSDELRSTMYHYVFIRASESGIRGLVQSGWNRNMTASLRLCYDHSGEALWATQKEMDRLVAMMIEFREVIDVVPSKARFEKGDQLQVKLDMFHGYEFSVKSFSGADKGANLVLELPLCNGRLTLRTKSVFVSDDYLPKEMRKLLSSDDIKDMERELIAIAGRRLRYRNDQYGGDDINLNKFHYLNYMQLDDTAEHRHIRVLLLLCAALRRDRRNVEALIPVVAAQLHTPQGESQRAGEPSVTTAPSGTVLSTDEEAFAAGILYIATRDASWRKLAKQYQQAHRELSEPLSLLMPIVKSIHFRAPKPKIDKKLRRHMSERVRKTLDYIDACDVSTLTPEAVRAILSILALPAYDTAEGRQVGAYFRQRAEALPHPGQNAPGPQGSVQTATGGPSALTDPSPDDASFDERQSPDDASFTAYQSPEDASRFTLLASRLKSSRTRLRTILRPTAADLETHYRLLLRVFPDRSQSDAHDYYVEFITRLRDIYKTEQPLSPSWWRMKALLEHYHNTPK